MNVLLDVNILLDFFLSRHSASKELILKSVYGAYRPYITANMITDIYYILSKHGLDAKSQIEKLLTLFHVLDVRKEDCQTALKLEMEDYEDALLVAVAQAHQIDHLVTRNLADFQRSQLIVYSPEEFMERLARG